MFDIPLEERRPVYGLGEAWKSDEVERSISSSSSTVGTGVGFFEARMLVLYDIVGI